jgi:hypothetical protein
MYLPVPPVISLNVITWGKTRHRFMGPSETFVRPAETIRRIAIRNRSFCRSVVGVLVSKAMATLVGALCPRGNSMYASSK